MDTLEISDFEFEELEDFDEWSKYDIIQSDDAGRFDRGDRTSSSSEDGDITSNISCGNNGGTESRKRGLPAEDLDQLRQRYRLCRPRIVKSDFRRKFPAHWVNVFNTGSYEYLMNHIRSFYSPDVTLLQRDLRPLERINTSAENVKSSEMMGVSVVSEFWFKAMNVAPDVVCKLKHSFVKVRSDGTSTIRCSVVLNGTKIVQLTNSKDIQHIQAYAQDGSLASAGDQQASVDPSAGDISATVAAMAAIAPDKIRTVLSVRRPAARSVISVPEARAVHGTVMTGTSDPASSVKATVINDRATWAAATVVNPSQPLEEIASMDRTEAAARYLEATAAVKKCTKKKRGDRAKNNSAEWFTLARDAFTSNFRPAVDTAPASEKKYNIPYTRLTSLCDRGQHTHSLRAENNNRRDTGLSYTAHTLKESPSVQPQVVLTAQLDFLCSVELNFNADNKIDSVVLNYIT